MEISSMSSTKKPRTFAELIKNIRSYEKTSVVGVGCRILWHMFRNRVSNDDDTSIVLRAFGPKIIILAMATGNIYKKKKLSTNEQFLELCQEFFDIEATIENHAFLEVEADSIINALSKSDIPNKYITKENIRYCVNLLFIQRSILEQNASYRVGLTKLFMDYKILKEIDSVDNIVSDVFLDEMGLSIEQVIRSGLSLLAVANNKNANGMIDFDTMKCCESITINLSVNVDTCAELAFRISYKESDLYSTWYEKELLNEIPIYQRYVPMPLMKAPILMLNKSYGKNKSLIVSPGLYILGFSQAIFDMVRNKDPRKRRKINADIGDAIENHIRSVFENKFGCENVLKLSHDGEKADFLISLDSITLVIEVKTDIESIDGKYISSPDNVLNMWNNLYKACRQLSSSIRANKKNINSKIISMVIVARNLTAECITFEQFGHNSGMFNDMGIDSIEFTSWNSLEYVLANASSSEIQRALLEKWNSEDSKTAGGIFSLKFNPMPQQEIKDFYKDIQHELLPNFQILK